MTQESFVKNATTGLIHNINDNENERYRMGRVKAIEEMKKKTDLDEMKKDIQGIKIVINKILEIVSKEIK